MIGQSSDDINVVSSEHALSSTNFRFLSNARKTIQFNKLRIAPRRDDAANSQVPCHYSTLVLRTHTY